ncbi:MAG: DUF502 domain-containing protein [Pirellulales bacterium]|nr:DUF502 domain-containing protein [Pirellulales bacterium]
MVLSQKKSGKRKKKINPFRRAVLRGLGILLPPLLTIAIFLWIGNTIADRLLEPLEDFARWAFVETADIQPVGNTHLDPLGLAQIDGANYHVAADNRLVPLKVYDKVASHIGQQVIAKATAEEIYLNYINTEWLRREYVVPVFLSFFVLVLYLLGKFMAAGAGRFFWSRFEGLIHHLPLVRNVYTSVKQVTDFLFTDSELEYTRVVAVEYPRKGIWSLGLVTGESMLDIRSAANEPVLSILVPTSPMPFTGYTMTVKKSETVDLNITVEQAFQFIISCGVVVPPQQLAELFDARQEAPMPAPLGQAPVSNTPNVPTTP